MTVFNALNVSCLMVFIDLVKCMCASVMSGMRKGLINLYNIDTADPINLPEVDTGCTLISVRLVDTTDAAFREENSNERGIVASGPFLDGKRQRVGIVFWWIRELQETVHRHLSVQCRKRDILRLRS